MSRELIPRLKDMRLINQTRKGMRARFHISATLDVKAERSRSFNVLGLLAIRLRSSLTLSEVEVKFIW